MRIEGAIYPTGTGEGFSKEAWCQLIDRRREFRRGAPRHGRDPRTGQTITLWPSRDAAEVYLEGQAVGRVWWSMSEERLVNVSIEPVALPLVLEWAAALGGEFREDPDTAVK